MVRMSGAPCAMTPSVAEMAKLGPTPNEMSWKAKEELISGLGHLLDDRHSDPTSVRRGIRSLG